MQYQEMNQYNIDKETVFSLINSYSSYFSISHADIQNFCDTKILSNYSPSIYKTCAEIIAHILPITDKERFEQLSSEEQLNISKHIFLNLCVREKRILIDFHNKK